MKHLPETCADVEAALPLYVGADLEPGELEAVARHLEHCSRCSASSARASAARRVLAGLRDRIDPPEAACEPGLWPGVRAALQAEGALAGPQPAAPQSAAPQSAAPQPAAMGPTRPRAARWRPLPLWRIGAGLAAAAAIPFLLLLAGERGLTGAPGDGGPALPGGPPVAAETGAADPGPGAAEPRGSRSGSATLAGGPVGSGPLAPGAGDAGVQALRPASPGDAHMLDSAWEVRQGIPTVSIGRPGRDPGAALATGRQ